MKYVCENELSHSQLLMKFRLRNASSALFLTFGEGLEPFSNVSPIAPCAQGTSPSCYWGGNWYLVKVFGGVRRPEKISGNRRHCVILWRFRITSCCIEFQNIHSRRIWSSSSDFYSSAERVVLELAVGCEAVSINPQILIRSVPK